jgi:hypothetical protein
MNVRWNQLIIKITIWVAGEVLLNVMGLDTLADYSEFFFEHQESFFVSELRFSNLYESTDENHNFHLSNELAL